MTSTSLRTNLAVAETSRIAQVSDVPRERLRRSVNCSDPIGLADRTLRLSGPAYQGIPL